MRIFALLSSFLAVALGLPFEPKDVLVSSNEADWRPLVVGDLLPAQGHVVVENPAPQPKLDSNKDEKISKVQDHKSEVNEVFQQSPIMEDSKADNEIFKNSALKAPVEKVSSGLNDQDVGVVEAYLEPNDQMVETEEIQEKTGLDHMEEGKAVQDLERKSEMFEQPNMKLEPLSNEDLQTGEVLQTSHMNNDVYEEPIMVLEPETVEDPLLNEEILPYAIEMEDEGPMLDALGQPMQHLEKYYPNNEVFMRLDPEARMKEESRMSQFDERLMPAEENNKVRRRRSHSCSGSVLDGKCFQFFQSPLKAADAEFYCQDNFHGGHLASITSPTIHNEMMNLMRQNGGTRRTWVGGLRFLDTGRVIWLDGSQWSYADWLSGEPNNTLNVENCVEVLASGKFNDFTCWKSQAFICSYPFQ